MTSSSPETLDPPRRPALTAFLRGIELRGWVFAFNQCGDEARAEQALARALHDFLAQAQAQPLATWPIRFWTSLLRQPVLMVPAGPGPALAELPPGPRAALLLRLVAGLDLAHAAEALGVAQPAYEAALHRALAHPALDEAGLQALRERLHAEIHDAPAAQRQLLATWRDEAVLALDDVAPVAPASPAPRPSPPRWMLVAGAIALVAVTTLAVLRYRDGSAPVAVIDPVAPPPAITDTIAATHPDYLQAAAGADEALARELAFLSWFAAAALPPIPAAPASDPPAPAPASFAALPAAVQGVLVSAREAWPELDPPTREMLLRQAQDWLGRSPAQREQLRARLVAWDKLPAPERARRRTPFLAWQRLDDADRRQLRAAGARLAGLPPAEQAALRQQFAAAPPDTQGLWWLGPALGQELAPFASLFAFMPEADRPALLLVLRELDEGARADLATLAPRLSEARRQALRRDLLAAPAARRASLIRERLAQ